MTLTCLACGAPLDSGLQFTASLRCHACRDKDVPLRWTHTTSVEAPLRLLWCEEREAA